MRISIFGAGAIGRGVLTPLFSTAGCEVGLVDSNKELVSGLREAGAFPLCRFDGDQTHQTTAAAQEYLHTSEAESFVKASQVVVVGVGVDGFQDVIRALPSHVPVVCCENDISFVCEDDLRAYCPCAAFMVPDVIAFCRPNGRGDVPSALVQSGTVFVSDDLDCDLPGVVRCSRIQDRWARKFFLHNTPHAVVSFAGWKMGYRSIPSAVSDPTIGAMLRSALDSVASALIEQELLEGEDVRSYASREAARFRASHFPDPVRRVARCASRKLRREERFFKALALIRSAGGETRAVAVGAACCALKAAEEDGNVPCREADWRSLIGKASGMSPDHPDCSEVGDLAWALACGGTLADVWQGRTERE